MRGSIERCGCVVAAALAWAAIGAGSASAEQLTVYSSLPLAGGDRVIYQDILDGARIALDEAGGVAGPHTVRMVSLNSASEGFGLWAPERVSRNARRAGGDDSTIAYLGEFHSGASAISLPAAQPLVAAFRARYGREPGLYMPYGYEAMRVVLDCIRTANDPRGLREGVIEAFFAIRNRDSALGRYSIDRYGDTTLSTFGVYGVEGGRLVFDQVIDSRG